MMSPELPGGDIHVFGVQMLLFPSYMFGPETFSGSDGCDAIFFMGTS